MVVKKQSKTAKFLKVVSNVQTYAKYAKVVIDTIDFFKQRLEKEFENEKIDEIRG